jgi:hypothetical protein
METPTENPAVIQVQEDYFGFGESQKFFFPDGVSFIEFQIMNEGQRREFQKKTNRDITFNRGTNDARIKADPAEERHALITSSVTGWNLVRNGQPMPFSKGTPGSTLEQWLKVANPKIVDDLEFAIRKANPWMQAEMTVEEIDKEMARLSELREQVLEREKGN